MGKICTRVCIGFLVKLSRWYIEKEPNMQVDCVLCENLTNLEELYQFFLTALTPHCHVCCGSCITT